MVYNIFKGEHMNSIKKKNLIYVCFIAFVLISSLFIFTACGDKESHTPTYTITVPKSDNYTISIDNTTAKEGTEINFTITPTNSDVIIEEVKYGELSCNKSGNNYSFIMPDRDVTINVQVQIITDVDSHKFLSWNENNVYKIASAKNDVSYNPDKDFGNPAILDFTIDNPYMTLASVDIGSSDETIIPLDAITYELFTDNDFNDNGSNQIVAGRLYIDLSKVNVGTAKILLTIEDGNLSGTINDTARIIKTINVVESGNLDETIWEEKLSIDFSNVEIPEGVNLILRVLNNNYRYGSNVNKFTDYELQIVNNIAQVTINYVQGCEFSLQFNNADNDDLVNFGFDEINHPNAILNIEEGRVFTITFNDILSSPLELTVTEI